MDDLFREILAPSPAVPSAALPAAPSSSASTAQAVSDSDMSTMVPVVQGVETAVDRGYEVAQGVEMGLGLGIDLQAEMEMQRLLELLPTVGAGPDGFPMDIGLGFEDMQGGIPSALDLDIGAWEMGASNSTSQPVF